MGIFDIIGPVMIGPSSSHTAGAARIGRLALEILGEELASADITLYGSFAKTGRGHGTDKALAAAACRRRTRSGTPLSSRGSRAWPFIFPFPRRIWAIPMWHPSGPWAGAAAP